MTAWLVLADDLTGACDTGAAFAAKGLRTVVVIAGQGRPAGDEGVSPAPAASGLSFDADVVVLDTESRALEETVACAVVRGALQDWLAQSAPGFDGRVYKKIDSTLRGHPAAELRAVMEALALDRALVAPAFPQQGRAVVDGHLLVNGQPLEETVFARESPSGDLEQVFGGCLVSLESVQRGAGSLRPLLESSPGLWLADSLTPADLETLAQAGWDAGLRLFCGSAGLAHALVSRVECAGLGQTGPVSSGAVLVAAGSRHPATVKQAQALAVAGVRALYLPDLRVATIGQDEGQEAAQRDALLEAEGALRSGRPVLVDVHGLPNYPNRQHELAAQLAEWVAALVRRAPVGRLVLTGGDTAVAVCRALGCTRIHLLGERQPGIAWGRLLDGIAAGTEVMTKAGGFGSERALLDLIEK